MKTLKLSFAILISLFTSFNSSVDAQDNKVVFEMFTNSHCGPCGNAYTFLENNILNSDIADSINFIFYHVATYSDDILFQQSKDYTLPRANFYGSIFSTPTIFINGNKLLNTNFLYSDIKTKLQNPSPLNISPSAQFKNDQLYLSVDLTNESVLPTELQLNVAIVEDTYYIGRNNKPNHYNVLRILPTFASGLQVYLSKDQVTNELFEITLPDFVDHDSISVIIFLQDLASKNIFKSFKIENKDIQRTTNINQNTMLNSLNAYPSPSSNFTTIELPHTISENSILTIQNTIGEIIYTHQITQQDIPAFKWNNQDLQSNPIPSGLYLITLKSNNQIYQSKILINK